MTTLRTVGRSDIGHLRQNNEDAIVSSRSSCGRRRRDGRPSRWRNRGEYRPTRSRLRSSPADPSTSSRQPFVQPTGRSETVRTRPAWRAWALRSAPLDSSQTATLPLLNIGDSRAYLWHRGALSQLTRDHSVTAELIERGELREDEAPQHPHYGVLTRALGVGT